MSETKTRLDQEVTLLERLERYRENYSLRDTVSDPDPVRLADYQRFLERLEDAIVVQRRTIDDLRSEFERLEHRWADRRVKRRTLGKAAGRYAQAEARAAVRDAQRELEEIAALIRARARGP